MPTGLISLLFFLYHEYLMYTFTRTAVKQE